MKQFRALREPMHRPTRVTASGLDFKLAAGKSKPQFWDPLTDV